MNMLVDRCELLNRWETYICLEIQKKVEQIIKDNRNLKVGLFNINNYEIMDENNNAVNLWIWKCS